MSRPRYWWYDYVKKSVIHSINSTSAPQSVQEAMAQIAVKKKLLQKRNSYTEARNACNWWILFTARESIVFQVLLWPCLFLREPPGTGTDNLSTGWRNTWGSCKPATATPWAS